MKLFDTAKIKIKEHPKDEALLCEQVGKIYKIKVIVKKFYKFVFIENMVLKELYKLDFDTFFHIILFCLLENCTKCRKYMPKKEGFQVTRCAKFAFIKFKKKTILKIQISQLLSIGKQIEKIFFAHSCIRMINDIEPRNYFKELEKKILLFRGPCLCHLIFQNELDLEVYKCFIQCLFIRYY